MAGQVPGFDAAAVRAGLRLAMGVGLPPIAADQPTFYFRREITNTTAADDEDVPFDPDARPTLAPAVFKRVPCAVEYRDGEGKIENFGIITPSRVVLTFLDEDYLQIKGFEYVVIGGDRYWYRRTEPPIGLVSVGVWTIHCTAEDES